MSLDQSRFHALGLAPELLKAVVNANQNNAGVYGTVTRIGRLAVGQPIFVGQALPPVHSEGQ